MSTVRDRSASRPAGQVLILVITLVMARIFAWSLLPPRAYSIDLKNWRLVAAQLLLGQNPYIAYGPSRCPPDGLLNWPPAWMMILFVLSRISDHLNWDIFSCIRATLIGADVVLAVATICLLRILDRDRQFFSLMLIGFCLNPLLVLLTVQDGNFDVIPTLCIVLFLISLIRYRRDADAVNWLWAAAWLGLGAFVKTFPLALLPLLAGEARKLSWKNRVLGAALCVGPAAVSLAPLYVLAPGEMGREVFGYRSVPGNSGVSALPQLLGAAPFANFSHILTMVLLAILVIITLLLWFKRIARDSDIVLLAALILMSIFEFGPGYGVQYWLWVAPVLLICFRHGSAVWRSMTLIAAIIIVLTNLALFAFDSNYGAFLKWSADPTGWLMRFSQWMDRDPNLARLSIPMSIATLGLIVVGWWKLLVRRDKVNP